MHESTRCEKFLFLLQNAWTVAESENDRRNNFIGIKKVFQEFFFRSISFELANHWRNPKLVTEQRIKEWLQCAQKQIQQRNLIWQ